MIYQHGCSRKKTNTVVFRVMLAVFLLFSA